MQYLQLIFSAKENFKRSFRCAFVALQALGQGEAEQGCWSWMEASCSPCWHPGKHQLLLLSTVPGLPRQISANLSLEEKDQVAVEGPLKPGDMFWGYGK